MTKAVFVKRYGALHPAEPEASEILAKIADGTELVADVRRPRDLHQLRKWWKLCTILADNMPVFAADKRAASDMVLIACHEVDWRIDPRTGEATPVPRSIAFESMEADAFDRLWRRAVFYVSSEWVPIGSDKLQAEIDDFFAGPDERARRASLGKRIIREQNAREAA